MTDRKQSDLTELQRVSNVSRTSSPDESVAAEYSLKPTQYFAGARKRFVDALPPNPSARLLEIGCGNGDTACYAKQSGKCGWSAGVELCHDAALAAANKMDHVLPGDIEQVDLPYPLLHFDVLILSEVLEHLRDPGAVLRKLRRYLAPGAWVLAGSPNVAHHSVVRMLARGRWDYTTAGILDETHLRWFTPETYRELFEQAGYRVEVVAPASPLRIKAKLFNWVTRGCFEHLLFSQIYLRARVD